MRKEFVIKRIDMPPDGSTYVIVTMTSAKDFQEGTKNQLRFDPSKRNPANMNDMMKDFNKMLSNRAECLEERHLSRLT